MTIQAPTPIELVMIAESVRQSDGVAFRDLVGPYVATATGAASMTANMLGLSCVLCSAMQVPQPQLGTLDEGSLSLLEPAASLVADLLAIIGRGEGSVPALTEAYLRHLHAVPGDDRPRFVGEALQVAAEVLGTVLYTRPVPPTE